LHRRRRSRLSLDHLILQIEDKPGEESGGEVEYGHDSREEVGMSGGVVVRIVILRPEDPETNDLKHQTEDIQRSSDPESFQVLGDIQNCDLEIISIKSLKMK